MTALSLLYKQLHSLSVHRLAHGYIGVVSNTITKKNHMQHVIYVSAKSMTLCV